MTSLLSNFVSVNSLVKWRTLSFLAGCSLAVNVNSAILQGSDKASEFGVTMQAAVATAQQKDPLLVRQQHSQDAIESMSVVSSTLPDPAMSVGFANLPTDGFDFSQEAMTQFKVGLTQQFPRGDSRIIRQQQLKLLAGQYPLLRQDRKAKLKVMVSQAWLNAYKAQESIALIESNRALFEQLADVAQASYSSASGKTQQQDLVRAQLELTRLDDRLTLLKQQQEMFSQQLMRWLTDQFADRYLLTSQSDQPEGFNAERFASQVRLSSQLPDIQLAYPALYRKDDWRAALTEHLSEHPLVIALEQKIKASRRSVELARQKYKPALSVNASYGYRDDVNASSGNNQMDAHRADLFSIGVSFDIPLFTSNRQDQEVRAAISDSEAIKTDKWFLLRKMLSLMNTEKVKLSRLNQRLQLYQKQLLPQMQQQAEASLTAYTNDSGDFAEVVRARIAELNAKIDALSIRVERQKSIIQLNYYFTKASGPANESVSKAGLSTARVLSQKNAFRREK